VKSRFGDSIFKRLLRFSQSRKDAQKSQKSDAGTATPRAVRAREWIALSKSGLQRRWDDGAQGIGAP
jgi:hypothetical protein